MDIKEIAKRIRKTNNSYMLSMSPDIATEFAEAIIESYRAELLKEVQGVQPELGEPVAYQERQQTNDGFTEWYDAYDGADICGQGSKVCGGIEYQWRGLYTSDQVAAAIAKAEQRVAEACALQVATETRFHWLDAARVAKEIRSGEWRKFVKEV